MDGSDLALYIAERLSYRTSGVSLALACLAFAVNERVAPGNLFQMAVRMGQIGGHGRRRGIELMSPHRVYRVLRYLLFLAIALVSVREASAVGIYDYGYRRSFALPGGGLGLYDALPDGRLLALDGSTVSVETAPKSGSFTVMGSIPGFTYIFNPAFLTVTPDGTRAAAGSNGAGSVVVFDTNNPSSVTTYAANDFTAEWLDNRYLAINSGSFSGSQVDILDTTTSTLTTVITNIGGASAGVAFDAAGNLYTGNAFDGLGPSDTGWIKAFSSAAVQTAYATNTPIDFESSGTAIADLLSSHSIGFDASGNMFVGGADFFSGSGDFGYAALVDAAAVAAALASPQATPPITPTSPPSILRKFPSPQSTIDGFASPNWVYNQATGELQLNYVFGDGTVRVYAVPEPASLLSIAVAGFVLFGFRRHVQWI